jgi:hypothetical protein
MVSSISLNPKTIECSSDDVVICFSRKDLPCTLKILFLIFEFLYNFLKVSV